MIGQVRDRIKELRRVPAGELRRNPKNWRTHPEGQQRALKEILGEVGYADALLARETPDGLELIDGHLRAEVTGESKVPVLVLDISEQEADKLLLTLDPLASLAGIDVGALEILRTDVTLESADLNAYFDKQLPKKDDRGDDGSPQMGEIEFRVVAYCADEVEQAEALTLLENKGIKCNPVMV